MPKVRVHNFSISLDGYAAGPDQSLDNPLGVGGHRLHDWAFATRTFRQMQGMDGGDVGLDDEFAAQGGADASAAVSGSSITSKAPLTGTNASSSSAPPPSRMSACPGHHIRHHDHGRRRRHHAWRVR